jgi:hypothetical protein
MTRVNTLLFADGKILLSHSDDDLQRALYTLRNITEQFGMKICPPNFKKDTIGVLGFDSRRGLGIFIFTTASRTSLGPTQPPIQRVPGALFLGVNRLEREADHSPPSSAEVKNAWSYTSTPPSTSSWCGA